MMTKIVDDDEAEIEAEIQRELEAIRDDDLQLDIHDVEQDDSPFSPVAKGEDVLPDSLQQYLDAVHSRLEGVEQGVKECDDVMELMSFDDDELLSRKIKETLGDEFQDNPLVLRDKVFSEISEECLNEEKLKQQLQVVDGVTSDRIDALESAAQQQMRELEKKQAAKTHQRMALYEDMRREEEKRREKEQQQRKKWQQEFDEKQKSMTEQMKVRQVTLEQEFKQQEEQTLQELQQKYQADIKEIEEEKRKEQNALDELKIEEARNKENKLQSSAIQIQRIYRGHRVYMKYKDILEARRRQRLREKEEEFDRIDREEKKHREKQEQKRKEEEQRRLEELEERKMRDDKEKQMNEELELERKRNEEEMKRKQEEERTRKEDEAKRTLEEARKKEEEQRLEKEKQKQQRLEEEKRRKQAEEERKRKEEEERERLEEEEKRRKQELGRQEEEKLLEEERRKQELARQEEEKRVEEERRKEALNRQEDERKQLEEKRRMEELVRKEEERKINEKITKEVLEKERKIDEENMRKEEAERELKKQLKERMKEEARKSQSDEEQIKEGIVQISSTTASIETSNFTNNSSLSADLEERRKQWLREHTPWRSQTLEDRVHPVTKAKPRPRRPFSASRNLPSLTEEQLLKSSPLGTPLYKVVRVCVEHSPACKIQAVSRCPELRALTLHDCGLMAVESLEECPQLTELDVQNNKVEFVNCGTLPMLEHLCLSKNNLSSVQGLEGCSALRVLDVSNNRITRLGDISSCQKLQKLIADNNQLIASKGLSSLRALQTLSCSHNHLPNVKEIDSCQLLQYFDLRANNLQQPPSLTNHVLLRELKLDDNSISSLEPLAKAWLPLLQELSVSQNSISWIDPLHGLPLLSSLNISHNLITDVDGVVTGLQGCSELRVLQVEGNPVSEDPQFSQMISTALPFLVTLDEDTLRCQVGSQGTTTPFIAMCKHQLKAQYDMLDRHKKDIREYSTETNEPAQVLERLERKSKHFREWHDLAVEHLIQHEEFGSHTKAISSAAIDTTSINNIDRQTHSSSTITNEPSGREQREAAATKIQASWRGWNIRHRIDVQMQRWFAAAIIQAAWRGYQVRSRHRPVRVSRARKALWHVRHHAAATSIQACYRGYRVRRRLARALLAAHFTGEEEEEEEFNYDEEVDLAAFDFDEGYLDTGWTPTDTPQLPSRGPALPSTAGIKGRTRKTESNPASSDPWQPRQAWRSADSPSGVEAAGRPRHAGISLPLDHIDQDLQSVTSGTQSHLTHRAEEMSNEWGLKNLTTAELMWKRANRMKYNPARKRRLLDPNKRLALFKKLDEANKLKEVRPPPKKQSPKRVEYFAARDSGLLPSGKSTPTSERHTKAQMTYSWVYNQGVIHQDQQTSQATMGETKPKKTGAAPRPHGQGSVSLPHMDPVSLTGRNVPLVSNPTLLQERASRNSTPTCRRKGSLSSDEVHFPPIKTYSVPNLTARSESASEASGSSPEKSNSAGPRMTKERRERR